MMFLYLIKVAIGTEDKKAESYLDHSMLVAPFDIFTNSSITIDELSLTNNTLHYSYPFQWCNKVLKYD